MTWRDAVVVLTALIASCVQSESVPCGGGLCREGTLCAPDGISCVVQAQIDVCIGASDGTGCSYPGTSEGVCRAAACTPAGCGNGALEPGELCDDGNRISLDGCRSDCLTRETCGDGAVEPVLGELCDCGVAGSTSAICSRPNSVEPGAACRPDCQLARCGDGVVDPGESCDDSNTTWGDGCRADCLGRFQKMQIPTARHLLGVWTSGPTDAYAAGEAGTLLHYDGSSWSSINLGLDTIGAVWGSGPSNVYVGTYLGAVRRFTGSTWVVVPTGLTGTIRSMWGSGPNDVYVVAQDGIARFNGTTWTRITACSMAPADVWAVTGTSASNVFIAGSKICRFNGTSWAEASSTAHFGLTTVATTVYAMRVDALTGFSAIVRGGGGTTWTPLSQPGNVLAFGGAGSELLAVGDNGVILVFDGTTWASLVSPTEQQLKAVAGTDRTNIFIVGDNGTILH